MVNVHDNLRRIFEMSGILKIVPIVENEDKRRECV